ncbi:MAG: aromatic ring-hydroxylating dioxygenase subunit alpha [Pseudomonadota bacterium]
MLDTPGFETTNALPATAYTSEEGTKQEAQTLFRTHWFSVGRADMVNKPGSYIALDIAGQSIILLRDRKGSLRTFANACRHRGARLVEGEGRCTGLRCPFHSWMFHLDGTLAAAPHMEEAEGFSKDDHALIAYRVEERLGFVFLCLNPDAPDLDTQLGNFAPLHAEWPLETLKTLRRRDMVVGCNWKAFLEVFNEYYHLPFVHPDTVDAIYGRPDPGDAATGAFATQFGSTEGTGGLLQTEQDKALPPMPGLTGRAQNGVRYSWIFPNMTFAASSDAMWSYEAYPLGPDRCRVVQTSCFAPETLEAEGNADKLNAYLDRLDAAIDEDIPALENQQLGLKCADAAPGLLHPLLESNVASFARWYRTTMTPDRSQT